MLSSCELQSDMRTPTSPRANNMIVGMGLVVVTNVVLGRKLGEGLGSLLFLWNEDEMLFGNGQSSFSVERGWNAIWGYL